MNTIEEAWDALRDMEARMDVIRRERDDLKVKIIEKFSPVKVGDTAEVNGWSHKGKKFRVDSIYLDHNYGRLEVKASGVILKSDGTPSKLAGRREQIIFEAD